ncbi:RING finger protein nhl-1 isoform X2 [Chironomus tepperi]|uniref:RING finger protein nhl-1 isoform X2 n=1 Tax=Chironomus tepperi TaxID=113505 RepID=UPI00391F6626
MEQFEQLLTCCVCLDRYRNPKLLPCQHSFCMEPCMDGLTDYVRRQVKCPECRAEHRIPYNGVQGFPTNVTLQRFLELHIEITGDLPDPTSGQVMERCNVCSEKSYCNLCMHCEKKICPDCKSAHMDILRREINRINNQIRRGVHRLHDILSVVEKNTQSLQNNCQSVSEEIDEVYRRLTKAVKDRTDHMRTEMDKYLTSEMKNLSTLKENLELEISNITSNSDLADKYMNESVEWEDCELMDTKEIFLKTIEFMRNFETETSDYSRRVRFSMACDPNQLVNNLCTYGDLHFIHPPSSTQSSALLQPAVSGIMRSKSDHRLATQFRQQQESSYNPDDEPLLGGRKFGERPKPTPEKHSSDSRYGYDYGEDQHYDSSRSGKNRFRSRFHRGHHEEEDETESRTVKTEKEKDKVTTTEDVTKGPLSGIFRILDSPRVMKRIQEADNGPREKKEPPKPVAPVVTQVKQVLTPPVTAPVRPKTARQQSEDEIERIKRENKTAVPSSSTETAQAERQSILKKSTPTASSIDENEPQQTTTTTAVTNNSTQKQSPVRSSSESSSTESTSDAGSTGPPSVKPAEIPPIRSRGAGSSPTTAVSPPAVAAPEEKKPFQSRFLQSRTPVEPPKKEETESSSEEESSEESESEEEAPKVKPVSTPPVSTTPVRSATSGVTSRSNDTSTVTPRTGILKDNTTSENRRSLEESTLPSRSRYEAPSSTYSRTADKENDTSRYGTRTRSTAAYEPPEEPSYSSRFLNKSKTSTITQPVDEQDEDSDSKYGTGRSRYMALKERRNRLARSRSSHNFGNDDDDADEPVSPTTASPSAYLASRYGTSSAGSELSRSRSTHALKSRENSPDRGGPEENKEALSSWARYLKNKYGSRTSTKDSPRDGYSASSSTTTPSASSYSSSAASSSSPSSASSTSASRRLSLGLPLRQANEMHSSDDDSKNLQSSLASPIQQQAVDTEDTNTKYCTPRTQYLQKRRQILQIGGRGSEPGKFTWPRGISANGPDNIIAVADSSNHRVQVFDANGVYRFEFGTYGNGDGEFDCLAGVAINRIGQFIIADRYNHRIQVFDPAGRFLRAFGSQGTADGKFNYPWGITTDSMGFIYVTDKENHRIQVFQSDGTFVGKFGSYGSGEGQLEHPHYIAVSNTNRVIVSDSNNHRIQIFDVNGKVLSQIGSEGSQEGEFKFPRGVAVDDSGYISVADSGNNRIQIFSPDGSFLRAFGSWGSGESEFKGLEGVAIMSNGNILVCDRENHRVQIF